MASTIPLTMFGPVQQQQHGILKRVTDADRGLVEKPLLTPHLEFRRIEDYQALLVSENFNTLLNGRIHCDLVPLLDGRRSREDITGALRGTHSAATVRNTLAVLAERGYVVSGDHGMDRARAAYWSSLGASPRWAEQRLSVSRVSVTGNDGRLTTRLEAAGVGTGTSRPSLSVIVCADYLDRRLAGINGRHTATAGGGPWMPVCPFGIQPLFGPVFRPAERGPCWACLAYRLRGHRAVHDFLRNAAGGEQAFVPCAAEPSALDAVHGLAAAEISRWLVFGDLAPLHRHAISVDLAGLLTVQHEVMRRPQCVVCGNEALRDPERRAAPVRLQPSPKPVRNSGGTRSVPPEQTLARYRHLVSPIAGIITWLRRTTDVTDPWLHVYKAGATRERRSCDLNSLRRNLRAGSCGKGNTRAQSEASALCEAVERYSGAWHGDEIRRRRRLVDFLAAGGSEAIHPNAVQLFSERQLDKASAENAPENSSRAHGQVPAHFDPQAEADWTPVWSLTEQRQRYLPTSLLYYMPAERRERWHPVADSNGCAAGNTLEEAILQGLFELVERDAFAIWWYNRLRRPAVDLESFDDDYLASATDYYRRWRREMWVLDITVDLGIPAFVAVSRRIDQPAENIIYGAGAHLDPRVAVLRAVCEMNQILSFQGDPEGRAADDTASAWWKDFGIATSPWLTPATGAAPHSMHEYAVPETADTREDIEHCRALVEARGMELLVLDQTRPDIGMPVARVIVPGLRHYWGRFAPGRLYDVPVEMGLRETPLAEEDLNAKEVLRERPPEPSGSEASRKSAALMGGRYPTVP